MTVTKEQLEDVVEKLQYFIAEMEDNKQETIKTKCNTYALYNFVSFGRDGYLDLDADYYDLNNEEE